MMGSVSVDQLMAADSKVLAELIEAIDPIVNVTQTRPSPLRVIVQRLCVLLDETQQALAASDTKIRDLMERVEKLENNVR